MLVPQPHPSRSAVVVRRGLHELLEERVGHLVLIDVERVEMDAVPRNFAVAPLLARALGHARELQAAIDEVLNVGGVGFDKDYYGRSPEANPAGPEQGTRRIVRGGSWHTQRLFVMSTRRKHLSPDNRQDDLGFRCARGV